jgi:hypothetical protein
MKLVRFGNPGAEKPGLVDNQGRLRDLSNVIADLTPANLSRSALQKIAAIAPSSCVERADALAHVAGYCFVNDVSEREYEMERGGTWDEGKGGPDDTACRTYRPAGDLFPTRQLSREGVSGFE